MFSRHTYLVVGLMVAGGAPYLSSQPAVQDRLSGWMPSKTEEESDSNSIFKFATADGDSIVSPPSTNPFGSQATANNSQTTSNSASSETSQATSSSTTTTTGTPAQTVATTRPVSTAVSTGPSGPAPVDGSRPIRFEEVFRLDVNSAWLMARWPRVTTGLAELDLHGYRVSLLTGKREDDLAGALTYYYDKDQVIQKMTFRGVTGDPRRLVLFATSQYGLEREIVEDPALQVYRTKGLGKRGSELTVRPAQVIRADAPHERFEVELILRR